MKKIGWLLAVPLDVPAASLLRPSLILSGGCAVSRCRTVFRPAVWTRRRNAHPPENSGKPRASPGRTGIARSRFYSGLAFPAAGALPGSPGSPDAAASPGIGSASCLEFSPANPVGFCPLAFSSSSVFFSSSTVSGWSRRRRRPACRRWTFRSALPCGPSLLARHRAPGSPCLRP